ncbi:hypothetical protein T440DRAFT_206435 [Plenodomus tracheiphilus IPT5]|uniref:Uncharacterized protein n=1 Tax=Plenodomus tracheiphilus IPT5 TaxID=1408161 RepID=A0A6A7BJ06_9PLEO|nr:hypothetical protein T440DRAFT_206435 [Plenodomus tracheiphilus IPT5]
MPSVSKDLIIILSLTANIDTLRTSGARATLQITAIMTTLRHFKFYNPCVHLSYLLQNDIVTRSFEQWIIKSVLRRPPHRTKCLHCVAHAKQTVSTSLTKSARLRLEALPMASKNKGIDHETVRPLSDSGTVSVVTHLSGAQWLLKRRQKFVSS